MTGNVSPLQIQVPEQRDGVGGVVRDRDGRRGMGAADPPASVVRDQPIPIRQRGLREEWQESVGQNGTDQQHGLAGAHHLVLERYTVDLRAFHACSS